MFKVTSKKTFQVSQKQNIDKGSISSSYVYQFGIFWEKNIFKSS